MEVAHIDAFRGDPARFWGFYRPRLHSLGDVEPKRARRPRRLGESRGLLEAVITQNIDMLHVKAGSQRVIEVHGSIRTGTCEECRTEFSSTRSTSCSTKTELRSARVAVATSSPASSSSASFPADAMAEAEALASRADLMLCIGSSLEVFPVAGLPTLTLGRGGRLAVITQGPTPFDRTPPSGWTATWWRIWKRSSRPSRPRFAPPAGR